MAAINPNTGQPYPVTGGYADGKGGKNPYSRPERQAQLAAKAAEKAARRRKRMREASRRAAATPTTTTAPKGKSLASMVTDVFKSKSYNP